MGPFEKNALRRFVFPLLVLAAGVSGWGGGQVAYAQLTPQQLLSTSVAKYEAKYADIGKAIGVFYQGDLVASRELLTSVRQKYPEIAPPDVLLAMLHMSANQRSEAEAALEQATINAPLDAEAFVLVGDIALREQRLLLADLAYDRAQRILEGQSVDSFRLRILRTRTEAGLASLSEVRKQYATALKHIEAWQKLDDKNPLLWGSLGRVRFHLGDYVAARTAFAELLKQEPNAPPVDVSMGRLYSEMGNAGEAQKCMEAALKTDGKDIRTQLTVAEWGLTNGVMGMAKSSTEAALKLDPSSVGGQVLMGRLARYEGDAPRARELLTASILKSPNEVAISNELARALAVSAEESQRKAGLDYATRNYRLKIDQNSASGREAIMTYAWLLLQNGKPEDAEKMLFTLPNASSVSSENAYIAALIYKARGRDQLAIQALRAALSSGMPFPGRTEADREIKNWEKGGPEPAKPSR